MKSEHRQFTAEACICVSFLCLWNKEPHQPRSISHPLNSKHLIIWKLLSKSKCSWGQTENQLSVSQLWPVAMQVRGSRRGVLAGPLPPLCVIQSPVIGGGKEKGPQSQWMSQTVRKKELALGTDIGNACQLVSSPLDGRFRGQCGGEALLGC